MTRNPSISSIIAKSKKAYFNNNTFEKLIYKDYLSGWVPVLEFQIND